MPNFDMEIIEGDSDKPNAHTSIGAIIEHITTLRMQTRDRAARRELGLLYRKYSQLLQKKIDEVVDKDSQDYLKITGQLEKANESIQAAIAGTEQVANTLNFLTDAIQTITELAS
ncbi:MAG: hypothetical protein AAF518_22335 [Spirochaetota bacterium]